MPFHETNHIEPLNCVCVGVGGRGQVYPFHLFGKTLVLTFWIAVTGHNGFFIMAKPSVGHLEPSPRQNVKKIKIKKKYTWAKSAKAKCNGLMTKIIIWSLRFLAIVVSEKPICY